MEQSAQRTLLLYSSSLADPQSNFGNPSSIHWAGRKAKAAIEDARDQIALALGIEDAEEILFTGSATESINTALKGFFFQHREKVRFISSAVEHEATLETLRFLQGLGAKVTLLQVNREGEIQLAELEAALRANPGEPTLVSLMAANNETGVIFPWEKAAKIAKEHGAFFHLDGAQAPGKLPGFHLRNGAYDLASFSAHKIGGPKGVGMLAVKRGMKLTSLVHGGAQERSRRAGTQNVAGIAAFGAAAAALAERDLGAIARLRDSLESEVKQRISGTTVQGAGAKRLVNTANFLFSEVRGEGLLMSLDLEGFAVSSGSACNSGSILPSHVLLAMGFDKLAAQSALRVSLGPQNTEEDVRAFVATLRRVVERIRAQPTRASLRG